MARLKYPQEQHIQQARELWELEGDASLLRKMHNYVYSIQRREDEVILRLTAPARRSKAGLLAELHWMQYLVAQGASVAGPIYSQAGEVAELLKIGNHEFFASVFHHARGRAPEIKDYKREFFIEFGKTVGEMHKLTKNYSPSSETTKRHGWLEQVMPNLERYKKYPDDPFILKILQAEIEKLSTLPKTNDCYGLTHSDFHTGNLFIDGKTLTIFDFETCCYHWYVYDIAVAMMHSYFDIEKLQLSISREEITLAFLEGYFSENRLNQEWLDYLPDFIRFREALVYCWGKGHLKTQIVDETARKELSEWLAWIHTELHRTTNNYLTTPLIWTLDK